MDSATKHLTASEREALVRMSVALEILWEAPLRDNGERPFYTVM